MATMTHTVTLTPEQSLKVDSMIAEGRFPSPDKAVELLLSQVIDEEQVVPYSPEVLAHLNQGMAEIERGELVSQEEVEAFFDDWRRNG